MIRHPISDGELLARIEAEKPGWTAAAESRTQRLQAAGAYHDEWEPDEQRVSWGDIKSVYRDIQGHKCGYCERPLAASGSNTPTIGASEHDVEHYRPKAKVVRWGDRKHAPAPEFDFAWSNEERDGYHWLAFARWNYCIACKVCNTELKGNRFPIRGTSGTAAMNRHELDACEQPLLLFPLGDIDDDPEVHIHFTGVAPTATKGSPRGRATIEFFLLDRRDDLLIERTQALLIAWHWIGAELDASPGEEEARRAATDALAANPKLLHANFVRSLIRLARVEPDSARQLHAAAMRDLVGTSAVRP